ncbi:MAG: hypothetical protein WC455_16270 [Dehalococcoidia bacterium]|jgi:hypothetical protein
MALEWPVKTCQCGLNLWEHQPFQEEAGKDENGKLIWTCHCPGCGRGYIVGPRVEVKPRPVGFDNALTPQPRPGTIVTDLPQDPTGRKPAPEDEEEEVIGAPDAMSPAEMLPGSYWCGKCNTGHRETSKLGRGHLKYKKEIPVTVAPAVQEIVKTQPS